MKSARYGRKFGELLLDHGFITEEQLKEALHHQETGNRYKPLGELCVDLGYISSVVLKVVLDRYRKGRLLGKVLVEMGAVSVDQLSEALSEQQNTGKRLGHILLDKRFITKADLAEALSIQLGIPKIVPNAYMVDRALLSRENVEYFRNHRAVPLSRIVTSGRSTKEIVMVLMEDPLDLATIAELEKMFNAEIQPSVSACLNLDEFLNEVFGSAETDQCPDSSVPSDIVADSRDARAAFVCHEPSETTLDEFPGHETLEGGCVASETRTDDTIEEGTLSLRSGLHVSAGCESDPKSRDDGLTEHCAPSERTEEERRSRLKPQREHYSRMSDLTKPSNRVAEPKPVSETHKQEEPEPKRQPDAPCAPKRRKNETPAPSSLFDVLKPADAALCEKIELVAPSKGMIVEQDDCDMVEAGRNAVTVLNSIVYSAVQARASDIHIEPHETKVSIRYRIDGVMRHETDLPKSLAAALTTRVKVLSSLDIAERRRHQDGRIEARIADKDIDLRVSTYASLFGENIVIRLLNRETALVDIDKLGFSPLNLERYLRLLSYPSGVMLVTGPTGSGKTTTLYASLMRLRDTGIKIITVEDPIEYTIEGVVQGRLDSRPDLSYEDFIKSMMRQDPDVIMIGEIRDAAGAAAAMQASLTGHKVLTSFHTDDTVSAVLRLADMNIKPFLISSTVVGILSQRLVRTLCPHCKEPMRPEKSLVKAFTSVRLNDIEAQTFYRAVGCSRCAETGYMGRTGVHELLEITEPLKEAILERRTASRMRSIARESAHLISMAEDGFYKAAKGITTIKEVLRLVFVNAADTSIPYHWDNLIAWCDGADDTNVHRLSKTQSSA